MAAGNTYEAIATQTLGSNAASVTFSSIPATYTDLILICSTKDTRANSGADDFALQFNNDTGTNYSMTYLNGDGSTATSNRNSNSNAIYGIEPGLNDTYGTLIYQIQNYSNTTTYKTALIRFNVVNAALRATVGMWRSTAAISTVKVIGESGIASGSTFSLYGIKSA
jgi:hypothetical protein